MKLVCAWCDRVIAGAIVGIEGGDEVAPSICKACFYDVFEEGDKTDISEIYATIQAKGGRYEN
jgi:hypothetical protein